ncbi:MAG: hypothetical protein KKH12_11970 [Gammaproteobacteria bacterium]|nr:hypothetical protein [Gammaproteobacteria bacterium]MBU1482370.1 hypothetical protein [Gammaproteobacteria bacterium]
MKKIVLSLASVLAATAFAPEASAIPAFARQTNQACTACHMQHFPVLNSTGQEFKAGGYTQMGTKGKIKGDDISIPDQLNAAVLIKARYQKSNGDSSGTISGTTTDSGQWQIPDELSLFFGGRVAEGEKIKIGMMMENNLVGGPIAGIIAGMKVPVVVALDPVNVMVIPYLTDGLGAAYGYEQSSTGTTRGIRWAENRKEISAAQYTGVGAGAASGIALVVHSDFGYVNLSRWSPNFAYAGGTGGVQMSSTWLRVAATPTIADWGLHIAYGVASGSNYCNDVTQGAAATPVDTDKCDTKGSVFDVQAQGAIADMETSFYFQTSKSPKSSSAVTKDINGNITAFNGANSFNSSTANDLKATTIGADVSVIPHTLHVGAAYRKGTKSNATADKDDAITLTAVYDLFQNVALHANYSKYSGPAYDAPGASNSLLTMMLEAAW